jgi:hypothetical protein
VGIHTFTQLAALSPAKLAGKVSGLSVKQITHQDWIGQARKIARKKPQPKHYEKTTTSSLTFRQHYENFTIEFLLDEKNRVRCTRVAHVQSGDADTWAGWKADQLVDFLARHAGVCIRAKTFEIPENLEIRKQLLGISDNGSSFMGIKSPSPSLLLSNIEETAQSDTEIIKPVIQSPTNTTFASILRLQDFKVLPIGSDTPVHSLRQNQPYQVRLTLDLTKVVAPRNIQLRYKAKINFKQLGGASCLVAEESCGILPSECVTLDIICASPPPGTYRPDAFVRLFSDKTDLGLMASLRGDLIQVF